MRSTCTCRGHLEWCANCHVALHGLPIVYYSTRRGHTIPLKAWWERQRHKEGDAAVDTCAFVLQELLVHLRHYSSSSKCEALAGLTSIFHRHPRFAEGNFARLAEPSLELVVCADDDVRK